MKNQMEEIRIAIKSGDRNPFTQWLEMSAPKFRSVANKLWLKWNKTTPHEQQIDDMLQIAAIAAWKAFESYKYICPHCTQSSNTRFESVHCWGSSDYNEFEQHMNNQHPTESVKVHISVDHRVRYLTGVAMQSAIRMQKKNKGFGKLSSFEELESVDLVKFIEVNNMEQNLDRKKKFDSLSPKCKSLVEALNKGHSIKEALAISKLPISELRKIKSKSI